MTAQQPVFEMEGQIMAWELTKYLVEGELYNTRFGLITGWLKLVGLEDLVLLDLTGNFCRDIRGARIHLNGSPMESVPEHRLFGFDHRQVGVAGEITAGCNTKSRDDAYVEWYLTWNGRVAIWLQTKQIDVIGTPRRFWEPEQNDIFRLRQNTSV